MAAMLEAWTLVASKHPDGRWPWRQSARSACASALVPKVWSGVTASGEAVGVELRLDAASHAGPKAAANRMNAIGGAKERSGVIEDLQTNCSAQLGGWSLTRQVGSVNGRGSDIEREPVTVTRLLYMDDLRGQGIDLFSAACARDLEGIVAKWRHGVTRWIACRLPD